MIASPNGIPRVINATSLPEPVGGPSLKIQKLFQAAFHEIQEDYELMDTGPMVSDEWSFLARGIPSGKQPRL